jgi:hypothetical protein
MTQLTLLKKANAIHKSKNPSQKKKEWADKYREMMRKQYGTIDVYTIESLTK